MPLLILSIAVLWTAPLLYHWAGRYTRAHRLVERVLLTALGIFVVVEIIPQSFRIAGWWTVVVVLLGMLVPSAVERVWHGLATKVHWVPLLFGTLGLAMHAAIDGAAFVDPFQAQSTFTMFQVAVVVHRFFEGLFIWWALRPKFGWEVAAGVLGFSTSFTIVGYVAGGVYFETLGTDLAFALFQALVAGSLLHLAVDRHEADGADGHGHGRSHHHHH